MKAMLACSDIPTLDQVRYPVWASPKLDGIRCVIIDGEAYSRNLKLIPNKYVRSVLRKLNLGNLDGELMVKGDFNSVQSAIMSEEGEPDFVYKVFDVHSSLAKFEARQKALDLIHEKALSEDLTYREVVYRVNHELVSTPAELQDLFDDALRSGFEGLILRGCNSPYKFGRSTMREGYMLKLKKFYDDEAVIVSCEELMRNTDTSTKRQENLYGAGTLGAFTVEWKGKQFRIGSGFDAETRARLWSIRDSLPGAEVTFKYQEVSRYGIPRFPTFKSIRLPE